MASACSSSDASLSATPEGSVRAHDARLMAEARAEAERGRGQTSPNPVVGALVVDEGWDAQRSVADPKILSRGHHILAARDHAEVAALKPLGGRAPGKTLYVTLEPCNHVGRTGRCTDAILAAGITRVVCGMRDPNPHVEGGGIARLRALGIDVVVGVQEAACQAQNRGFVRAMIEGRPQVVLKAALSIDGRIAPASAAAGQAGPAPIWLSSAESRAMAHRLRADSDAILVGIGTVLADDPRLTVRLAMDGRGDAGGRQPLRVVLDSHLRTPLAAKLATPGTLLLTRASTLSERADHAQRLRERGCDVQAVESSDADGGLDLRAVLRMLCQRGVHSLLCEGGGMLHGGLLAAGLADEVALFIAPLLLGDQGVPLVRGLAVPTLKTAPWLTEVDVQRLGPDLWLRGLLRPGPYQPTAPSEPTTTALRNPGEG